MFNVWNEKLWKKVDVSICSPNELGKRDSVTRSFYDIQPIDERYVVVGTVPSKKPLKHGIDKLVRHE